MALKLVYFYNDIFYLAFIILTFSEFILFAVTSAYLSLAYAISVKSGLIRQEHKD